MYTIDSLIAKSEALKAEYKKGTTLLASYKKKCNDIEQTLFRIRGAQELTSALMEELKEKSPTTESDLQEKTDNIGDL